MRRVAVQKELVPPFRTPWLLNPSPPAPAQRTPLRDAQPAPQNLQPREVLPVSDLAWRVC